MSHDRGTVKVLVIPQTTSVQEEGGETPNDVEKYFRLPLQHSYSNMRLKTLIRSKVKVGGGIVIGRPE